MSGRPCGVRAKYVLEKCRCRKCTAANKAYRIRVHRRKGYGQWKPFVDAAPVRAHIQQLRAAGMGLRQLAALSGIGRGQLDHILRDRGGRARRARVRASTAEPILAVTGTLEQLSPAARVPAVGSVRRLQALVAIGWPQARLASALGMTDANFGTLLRGDQVNAARALAVIALYERLWSTPPPERNRHERQAASRSRNRAEANGWPPPMAWDDDKLDDPAAEPAPFVIDSDLVDQVLVDDCLAGRRSPSLLSTAERFAAARQLTAQGHTVAAVAKVLNTSATRARQLISQPETPGSTAYSPNREETSSA